MTLKVEEDSLRNYINKPEGRAGRAASFLKMTNIKNRPITIIISRIIEENTNIFFSSARTLVLDIIWNG